MTGRWVIRGLLVGMLLCTVAAWVGSMWYFAVIAYGSGGRAIYCRLDTGHVIVWRRPWNRDGWHATAGRIRPLIFLGREGVDRVIYLTGASGFGAGQTPDGSQSWVVVPCWFLVLLAGIGCWMGWGKGSRKGRAFPVEVSADEGKVGGHE